MLVNWNNFQKSVNKVVILNDFLMQCSTYSFPQ